MKLLQNCYDGWLRWRARWAGRYDVVARMQWQLEDERRVWRAEKEELLNEILVLKRANDILASHLKAHEVHAKSLIAAFNYQIAEKQQIPQA